MKRSALVSVVVIFVLALSSNVTFLAQPPAAATPQQIQSPRPIEMPDILAWKRLGGAMVSNDGQFFAHRIVPNEGDAEVVLRRLKDGKEWRFPIGEMAAAGAVDWAFSDDNKWFAFTVYPTFKDSKRLKKERKPLQNKVTLINLSNEQKTEFEKVRRFLFSGEMGGWVALQKYAPEGGGGPSASPPVGSPAPDRATGTDLILQELATGSQLNFGNVADFAFNKKGDWLAFTIDANEKSGNGVQARNMATGAVLPLDSDKAIYRGLNWTEKGDALAIVKGTEDKAYEEKLYSVVGISFSAAPPKRRSMITRATHPFQRE